MKTAKILLLAVAASIFIGCTVDHIDEGERTVHVGTELQFNARLCDGNPQSRTSIVHDGDDILAVLWSPGDDINVFHVFGDAVSGGHFINSADTPSDKTSFCGTMASSCWKNEGESGSPFFWALYPYSKDNTCNGKEVTFSIPATQSSPSGSFADGQWPTMARSRGFDLSFYSICSGIMFKVAGEGVTSVIFTNRDGGAINGTVTASWDDSGRPVISDVSGTDSIVVTPADAETFKVGDIYYAVLPVVTMTDGIEVTYRTADSYCTYVNGRNIPFQRNTFNRLFGRDTEYTRIPKTTYYASTEAVSGQSYVLVSNGFALKNDGGNLTAEDVTAADGTIDLADGEGLLWTAGEPYDTPDAGYSGKTFSNGSKYLYRNGSSISVRDSASDKYSNFSYEPHPELQESYCLISGGTYYTFYSTDNEEWKAGSSSGNTTVTLYSLTRPKQDQNLSFESPSVVWIIGDDYQKGGSYGAQAANDAQTSVSYSSSDSSVATVSGSMITIKGAGTVTVTATAAENENYKAASASYTLTIYEEEKFNLENNSVSKYLDEAATKYTDSNWESATVVQKYCSNSTSNRKDIPAPVTLSWKAVSEPVTYTVSVYDDITCSDLVTSVTTSTTSADIYNLIPGRKYFYTVESGDQAVKSGIISTFGRVRMVKVGDTNAIGHAINCRDFGGMNTTEGKNLKYGMLFRGSNMDATTNAEKEFISGDMNVALDIDLRNGKTTSKIGDEGSSYAYDSFKGSYGVSYVCGDFEGGDDLLTTDPKAQRNITQIFTDILSAFKAGKAAYIHCRIGADRTGYICMLLQAVLGVSPKDCSIDFELTSFSKVGTRLRDGNINPSGLETYYYIDRYGKGSTFKEKAYNILLDYGITPEQISSFRSFMLE